MTEKINLPQIYSQNNKHNFAVKDNYKYIPEQYKEVAKELETQFNSFLLEKMQESVQASDDQTTKFYKSMLTGERAKLLANQNAGSGIQELILNEIYPKHLRNQHSYNAYLQQNNNDNTLISKPRAKNGQNIIKANQSGEAHE